MLGIQKGEKSRLIFRPTYYPPIVTHYLVGKQNYLLGSWVSTIFGHLRSSVRLIGEITFVSVVSLTVFLILVVFLSLIVWLHKR